MEPDIENMSKAERDAYVAFARRVSKEYTEDLWAQDNIEKERLDKEHRDRWGTPKSDVVRTEKVKVDFFLLEFAQAVHETCRASLEELGKKMITAIKKSMRPGSYRPYLSKRPRVYSSWASTQNKKMWTRTYRSVRGILGVSMAAAKAQSVKLVRKEAFKWSRGNVMTIVNAQGKTVKVPTGRTYVTGTYYDEKTGGVGTVIGRLSRAGRGVIHWASHPGKPPAPDTERLLNSLSYVIGKSSLQAKFAPTKSPSGAMVGESFTGAGRALTLAIKADRPYAKILETGGKVPRVDRRGISTGGFIFIAPRPYISPQLTKFAPQLNEMMRKRFPQFEPAPIQNVWKTPFRFHGVFALGKYQYQSFLERPAEVDTIYPPTAPVGYPADIARRAAAIASRQKYLENRLKRYYEMLS